MRVFNFGSINIDHVYRVGHIVAKGETVAGRSYRVSAGGKGANQSVALARAGVKVMHVGHVGRNAGWVLEKLIASGVDTSLVTVSDEPTGHAIIQVDDWGQNSIVLFSGANFKLSGQAITTALNAMSKGDILLLQNETNSVASLIREAHDRGIRVVFNPAPFNELVLMMPLGFVDTLILNEHEARGVANVTEELAPDALIDKLAKHLPNVKIVVTLGERGVLYRADSVRVAVAANKVDAVDTTAAGDTFIGYYIAAMLRNLPVRDMLKMATKAAGICVTRQGAMDSIPLAREV